MKYAYTGKEYNGEGFSDAFGRFAQQGLKQWLEAIIYTEKPYLSGTVEFKEPDEETIILLRFCDFFSAVLRDECPEPIQSKEWGTNFEDRHHGLVGFYLNFIKNVYLRKQE